MYFDKSRDTSISISSLSLLSSHSSGIKSCKLASFTMFFISGAFMSMIPSGMGYSVFDSDHMKHVKISVASFPGHMSWFYFYVNIVSNNHKFIVKFPISY